MTETQYKWPLGDRIKCKCPYCGHFDEVDISLAREQHENFRPAECPECFGDYLLNADSGAVKVTKSWKNANTFCIRHFYDRGDQGVTIEAPSGLDTRRAAVYIQFQAENWFGDEATVTNLGIAAALVSFYGCQHASHTRYGEELDMYSEREKRCPKYDELIADASLARDGLKEFLKGHVDV